MDRLQEKTTVPYPPVGADGGQSLSKIPEQSIAEEQTEHKPQERDFREIMRKMDRVNDPAYLPSLSMNELYEKVYPGKPPVVEGLLYPGVYLFVGAPKVGKSFLMAQLAYHVSKGLPLWGYEVRQGVVLYLALEDDFPRLQGRLYRMFGEDSTADLHLSIYAKQLNSGLEEQLKGFVREHPDTRLIIIDTLQKIREAGAEKYRCKDKSLVGKVKETVMQVSMSKKWESKPVLDEVTGEPLKTAKGKPVLKKSYSVLQDDFFQYMREAGYADIERGERGSSEEHLTVTQFKVEREQARLAKLQTEKTEVQAEIGQLRTDKTEAEKAAKEAQTELQLLAPKLKSMEKLAAEYSSDPEDLLPLPDRMESAKSYREKKSKPLLEKIVKVVRSVYRAYLDVCQKFELLQRKYDTEVPYLKKQLAEVKGENAELQETARDYHRLCRAYGPERVAETVAAVKQQEQAEKEQKRSQKRRHDRDAR